MQHFGWRYGPSLFCQLRKPRARPLQVDAEPRRPRTTQVLMVTRGTALFKAANWRGASTPPPPTRVSDDSGFHSTCSSVPPAPLVRAFPALCSCFSEYFFRFGGGGGKGRGEGPMGMMLAARKVCVRQVAARCVCHSALCGRLACRLAAGPYQMLSPSLIPLEARPCLANKQLTVQPPSRTAFHQTRRQPLVNLF